MEKNMNEGIDFVLIWVDDKDPKWIAKKNKYKSTNDIQINVQSDSEVRYRDWDNLKYWFRAVEKYAPWVRKVHFVTCGQKPTWLNENNPKLRLVNHSDYIDEKYLPTFSSHVIELNLHKIPGLSERFVYFNEDTFINNYVSEDDFFKGNLPRDSAILNTVKMDRRGITHIIVNNLCVISEHFIFKKQFRENWRKWISIKYGKEIFRTLCLLPWNRYSGFYELHIPYSYSKKTFCDVWNCESEYLSQVCEHKFRDDKDVNQWLMRYWQIASGYFEPRSPNFGKMYDVGENMGSIINDINKGIHKTICINDSEQLKDFEGAKRKILKAFENKLPDKSSFEL